MTWRFIPHVSLACQKGKCNECLFFTLLLLLQGSSQNGSGGGHYYRDSRDRERPPTKSPSSDHDLDNISDLSVSKSKLHISQKYGKNSKIWGEKKLKTLRSVGLRPLSLRFSLWWDIFAHCAWGQPITGLLSLYQKWNLRGNQRVLGQVRLHYSSLGGSLDGIFTWLGDKVKPHNENIVLFPSSVSSTKIQHLSNFIKIVFEIAIFFVIFSPIIFWRLARKKLVKRKSASLSTIGNGGKIWRLTHFSPWIFWSIHKKSLWALTIISVSSSAS